MNAYDNPSSFARGLAAFNRTGIRVVPLSLTSRLSLPIADAVHGLWTAKRETARRNFAHVLGLPPDDPRVERTARECFRHFGRYAAEVLSVQGWGTSDLVDRLDVEGEEYFAEAEEQRRGVIFISGHIGSTEVAAALARLKGFEITSVAEEMDWRWLMDYLVISRKRMGVTLLPETRAGISLIRTLRRGRMVAFVVDAGVDHGGAVSVDFFGRQTLFPDGPARLSRLTGAPIVFGMAARLPRGRYRVHVCPPLVPDREANAEADVRRLTQAIAGTLERFVRRYPSQWYAFRDMWPR